MAHPNAELIERFDLDPTKKARTYSKGNRQKVSLVSALSSNAQLLLLDEPLSNLDAKLRQEVRVEIRDLQRKLGLTEGDEPKFVPALDIRNQCSGFIYREFLVFQLFP